MTTSARGRRAPQRDAYYGFDPNVTYVVRSKVRSYTGVTERYQFALGQATAYPMRDDATEEQREARGERLARLDNNPSYKVYRYGEEPDADLEPMWAGQNNPLDVGVEVDTGEETRLWQPAPEVKPAVRQPVEGPTPSGQSSREVAEAAKDLIGDTGEQRPPAASGPAAPPGPQPWDRSVPNAAP